MSIALAAYPEFSFTVVSCGHTDGYGKVCLTQVVLLVPREPNKKKLFVFRCLTFLPSMFPFWGKKQHLNSRFFEKYFLQSLRSAHSARGMYGLARGCKEKV